VNFYVKSVLISFEILTRKCEYKHEHDNDCHHPGIDFDCMSCGPWNCPLLLEDIDQ
jgi:hypothetical protein